MVLSDSQRRVLDAIVAAGDPYTPLARLRRSAGLRTPLLRKLQKLKLVETWELPRGEGGPALTLSPLGAFTLRVELVEWRDGMPTWHRRLLPRERPSPRQARDRHMYPLETPEVIVDDAPPVEDLVEPEPFLPELMGMAVGVLRPRPRKPISPATTVP